MVLLDNVKTRAIIDDVMIEGASDNPLTKTTLNNGDKTMQTTINNKTVKMYTITVTNLSNNQTESFADRYSDKRDALHTAISWGWSLNAPYEYTVHAWLADNSVVEVYSGYNLNR